MCFFSPDLLEKPTTVLYTYAHTLILLNTISMKIKVNKTEFYKGLETATHFTSPRIAGGSSVQGVLVRKSAQRLHLHSTNLSSFFHTHIPILEDGGKEKEEEHIIEPQKIIEFLGYLDLADVILVFESGKLTIESGKTTGVFPLVLQSDIPLPPARFSEEKKIKPALISRVAQGVLFSASRDSSRPVLGGVNFVVKEDGTTDIVATDGFRLSLLSTKEDLGFGSVLLPSDFLSEVLRFIKSGTDVFVRFAQDEKIVCFRIGDSEFFSRLIEGEFPPYERVVPVEKKGVAIVARDELIRGIKLISVFAKEFSNIVLFDFSPGTLTLSPKAEAGKENNVHQDIQYEGESMRLAFNYRFLLEYLAGRGDEAITIEVLRPDAPVVFKAKKEDGLIHIIMPVRIQE